MNCGIIAHLHFINQFARPDRGVNFSRTFHCKSVPYQAISVFASCECNFFVFYRNRNAKTERFRASVLFWRDHLGPFLISHAENNRTRLEVSFQWASCVIESNPITAIPSRIGWTIASWFLILSLWQMSRSTRWLDKKNKTKPQPSHGLTFLT